MNKLMTVAAGLLLSTSAFASNVTLHNDTTVMTSSFATKAEALDAGFNVAQNLSDMSQNELRIQLPVDAYQNVNNINIDNTEVKVEEFALVRGEVQYRAVVNVGYHFNAKETR
ncbi:DUF3316 domain-containing protein [Vibrio diazotrophicus]|uniref:DUF3316 domain-containing protein n=1 Tax=Vibrio diazotrophicus TaxID=685 RepID=UPI00142E62CA|nr:DUF3316 domain-containing protein [Vibrio diazotrophicus]NIY92923.1 DUF3316 domain-containing protein [Vibrio diazotrophicus]